jgi:hypothetical protein
MINWVIGGIIVGLTAFIIIRTIMKMRKGESSCGGDCASGGCNCPHKQEENPKENQI